uniref:Dual specificity phosphatase catalytic domain-containing protein n=1 Tax=Melopsittacus undulatus TaxID=13146 RepID=A0A8V5H082_MELUD
MFAQGRCRQSISSPCWDKHRQELLAHRGSFPFRSASSPQQSRGSCASQGGGSGLVSQGLGSRFPGYAKDLEQLTRNKITHIVSIHESPQPLLQDITYLRIPLPDTPEANIKRHFKECISFIHQCRLHGGNCLVHW